MSQPLTKQTQIHLKLGTDTPLDHTYLQISFIRKDDPEKLRGHPDFLDHIGNLYLFVANDQFFSQMATLLPVLEWGYLIIEGGGGPRGGADKISTTLLEGGYFLIRWG